MPQGRYDAVSCPPGKKVKPFEPQPHQIQVRDHLIETEYTGLLLYHRLGSGKTCTAIMAAEALLDKGYRHVFVFTTGSLRVNFIKEYCYVCGRDKKRLRDKYTFLTYNFRTDVPSTDEMSNCVIIIDEVHNMINSVMNRSKTGLQIYERLYRLAASNEIRIIALTGTPITRQVDEIPMLLNLFKPNSFKPPNDMGGLGSTRPAKLDDMPAEELNEVLTGIISYVPGFDPDAYARVVQHPPIMCRMNDIQSGWVFEIAGREQLIIAMNVEHLRFKNPGKYKKMKILKIMAAKRIMSRSISNAFYNDLVYDKAGPTKNRAYRFMGGIARGPDYPPMQNPPDLTVVEGFKEKNIEDGNVVKNESPLDLKYPAGWIERRVLEDGGLSKLISNKFYQIMRNIGANLRGKHLVFSFFKIRAGVMLLKTLLEMCGLKAEVYSGDLTDVSRLALLKRFNSPGNAYGDDIKVILATDAGAEGITLNDVQHVHIVESDMRETKIRQVIGRAVRFKSHDNLKPAERVVHVWRYWSVHRLADPAWYTFPEQPPHRSDEWHIEKVIPGEMLSKGVCYNTSVDARTYYAAASRVDDIDEVLNMLQRHSI